MDQSDRYPGDRRAYMHLQGVQEVPPPPERGRRSEMGSIAVWIRLLVLPFSHAAVSFIVAMTWGLVYGVLVGLGLLWLLALNVGMVLLREIGMERRDARHREAREQDRMIRDQTLAQMMGQWQREEQ